MKDFRIVFLGTSQFAVPALAELIKEEYQIVGVFTQPDRPNARGNKVFYSPVKEYALTHSLPLFQPQSIKTPDSIKQIQELQPDLIVVVSYGQILPKSLIELPQFQTINIHGSLLPNYRGASPIVGALLNNEETTGVTIMLMDEKLDHGPILSQKEIPITNQDDIISLNAILSDLGAKLLIDTIPDYVDGTLKPKEQNHEEATFTKLLKKEDGKINWNQNAQTILQKIKAHLLFPSSYTYLDGKQIKITKAHTIPSQETQEPGTIQIHEKQLLVHCKENILVIDSLQMQGKKETEASSFIQGYQLDGKRFES